MTQADKAYRIEIDGFGAAITLAATAAKARYRAYAQGQEAGYQFAFGEIHVQRASQYDHVATSRLVLEEWLFP